MSVDRVGVVGAGAMGAGIAQVACLGGFETALHDPVPEALESACRRLETGLEKGAQRRRWSAEEAASAAARLTLSPGLEGMAGCDLVIEAAPEDVELKRQLFSNLAEVCGPRAILATNTSSLSVTAIAAEVPRPERIVGMHFFNPPALMRLVEIVAGDDSGEPALAATEDAARQMGRTPIRAADEIGFVGNRCARPYSLEALRLLGAGIADHEAIDRICRLGGGFRMGPFELTDLVGVDVNLDVARSFWEQSFHEPRWQPHPIQARMVASGRHGRKSGRGYYDYSLTSHGGEPGTSHGGEAGTSHRGEAGTSHRGEAGTSHRGDDPDPPQGGTAAAAGIDLTAELIEGDAFRAVRLEQGSLAALGTGSKTVGFVALPDLESASLVELARGDAGEDAAGAAETFFRSLGKHVEWVGDAPGLVLGRIVCQLVNEAHFALGSGVATAADIDTAMRLGFNYPRGPFEWCEVIGAGRVLAILDGLRAELGEERYRAAPSLRRAATRQSGPESGCQG